MRVLVVTDAWRPQVNGVVRTLENLLASLHGMGVATAVICPADFPTVPMPSYPDIRLAVALPRRMRERIETTAPDTIHIATEGPLGIMARRYCIAHGIPFTTSYHTRFPEFLSARLPVPERWSYAWLRRFHNSGHAMLVATPSLRSEMERRGFRNIRIWSRGVDTIEFNPARRKDCGLPRPIFLNVGRVAVEKNLPAFLDLDLPGSKVVVGDGPDLPALKGAYPDVHFLGTKMGGELAEVYASADVFVFPSRADTFGNVILEALASGTPVAAYPVTGPVDILGDGKGGALDEDLREAALRALDVPRNEAVAKASGYDWNECARQFLSHLPKTAMAARAHGFMPRPFPGASPR
jgi:glycosyltransferase involved in cell wall biosynthesis